MSSSTDVLGPIHQVNGEEIFRQFLRQHAHINFLRVCYVDYFNILHSTVIPRPAALNAVQSKYLNGFLTPIMAGILYASELNLPALDVGLDELHYDWSSLKECKFSPGHAMVMTFVREPKIEKPNGGLALDPRWQLHHQLEKAKPYQFLIGHEIEFFLYSDATDFGGLPPAGNHMSSFNLRSYTHVLDEIVLDLCEVGIGVNKYHAEDGPLGCFEIALSPLEPMEAADALVYSHELIRCVAKKHEMSVTFSPSPFEKGLNMGSHLNLSIQPKDAHQHFLAGLLEHLPAACAFLMPTYEGGTRQKRMGTWVRWGLENKLAVVRLREEGLYEIRCVDGTANPYLAAAVLIAAGMHGVEKKTPLTMKPWNQINEEFSEGVRNELGVKNMIPASLTEALDELEKDKSLVEGLGSDLVSTYTMLKKHESKKFQDMTSDQRRANLRKWY